MGFLSGLKNLFGGSKSNTPAELNSPDEIKAKMDNLMAKHDSVGVPPATNQPPAPGAATPTPSQPPAGSSEQVPPTPPTGPTPPVQPAG